MSKNRQQAIVARRSFLAAASFVGLTACARGRLIKPMAASATPRLTIFFDENAVNGARFLRTWLSGDRPTAAGLSAATLNRVDRERTAGSPYTHVLQLDFRVARDRAVFVQQLATKRELPDGGAMIETMETVIRPVSSELRGGAKRIGLVGRAPDKMRSNFVREWRNVHAPEVDDQPGLAGYSINVAATAAANEWDGYAELWWPNWDIYASATRVRLAQPSTRGFFHRRLLLLVEELSHRRFPERSSSSLTF